MNRPVIRIVLLLLGACDQWGINPKPKLPAETQEGKQTFGCKVNGKIWLPKGKIGELEVQYYPNGYGLLNISASQDKDRKLYQSMVFASDSVPAPGVYDLLYPKRQAAGFSDYETRCRYLYDATYREGTLTITKLDKRNRIVSGRFEFTLAMPGCDTIRVTEGRFDVKYD